MWAVATGLSDIADVANWMRNYVIDRYQDQHPWLLQLGVPDAGFFSLFGMLAGKALAGLWAQRSAAWNQIKGGVGAAVGWVGNQIGRAAAWVGGLFA